MGTYSGKQIGELVSAGKLTIEPFDEGQVQPASYDLLLGAKVLASPLNAQQLGAVVDLATEQTYEIQSGQMVGVLSYERLRLPLEMCGRFGIRSAFARRGVVAFGGLQLDPGFKGRLTMNLINVGPEPVTLTLHEAFFTVEFQRLEEPATLPYSGPFQDQDDFPAEQYQYILKARTTSLAEIPALRREMSRLSTLIADLQEGLPEPDEGMELRPETEERLRRSRMLSPDALLSPAEMRRLLSQ